MKSEIITACYQLVTAFINGTCQGIVLTVLVAGGLRLLRRTNSATRHAVWFCALLLVTLMIPANWLRERRDAFRSASFAQASAPASPFPSPSGADNSADTMEPFAAVPESDSEHLANNPEPRRSDPPSEEQSPALDGTFGHENTATEGRARLSILAALDANVVDQARANNAEGALSRLLEKAKSAGQRLVTPISWKLVGELPLPLAAAILLLWLAVAVGKVSLLLRQVLRIRELKGESLLPPPELRTLFDSLRKQLRVRRSVSLKVSDKQRSPVVLGFLKPAILLPADAGLNEAEPILRHELAHVRRWDDWANLVQHSIGAVFFFHPAICWISKRLSLEREIACDDQVLESTRRPRAYALLLAEMAGRLQPSILAPGVSTHQSQLKQRIDMILNQNRNTSPGLAKARLGLFASMTAVLAAAAIYSAPRLVFAQTALATEPPETPPTPPAAALVASEETAPVAVAGLPGEEVASASPEVSLPPSVMPLPPEAPVAGGPRFKPGATMTINPPALAAPGAVVLQPAPSVSALPPLAAIAPAPVSGVRATTPVPPVIAVSPAPAVAAVTPAPRAFTIAGADPSAPEQPGLPPRPPRRGRDSSLEERLDRLEKMVESLVAQQKNKPGPFEFHTDGSGGSSGGKSWFPQQKGNWANSGGNGFSYNFELKQPEMAKRQAELDSRRAELEKRMAELQQQSSTLGSKDKTRLKDLAEQQAKIAEEQAKIAHDAEQMARDAQRAARDAQQRRTEASRGGNRQELESLHRQHEALQRQMEKLERQIEKLERERERSEDDSEKPEQDDSNKSRGAQKSNYNDTACSDSVQMLQRFELPAGAELRRL